MFHAMGLSVLQAGEIPPHVTFIAMGALVATSVAVALSLRCSGASDSTRLRDDACLRQHIGPNLPLHACTARQLYNSHTHAASPNTPAADGVGLSASEPGMAGLCAPNPPWRVNLLWVCMSRLAEGVADRSFGLNVARMAQLPGSVVECAGRQAAAFEASTLHRIRCAGARRFKKQTSNTGKKT